MLFPALKGPQLLCWNHFHRSESPKNKLLSQTPMCCHTPQKKVIVKNTKEWWWLIEMMHPPTLSLAFFICLGMAEETSLFNVEARVSDHSFFQHEISTATKSFLGLSSQGLRGGPYTVLRGRQLARSYQHTCFVLAVQWPKQCSTRHAEQCMKYSPSVTAMHVNLPHMTLDLLEATRLEDWLMRGMRNTILCMIRLRIL